MSDWFFYLEGNLHELINQYYSEELIVVWIFKQMIFTARQRNWRGLMFSLVSVFRIHGGPHVNNYPWRIGASLYSPSNIRLGTHQTIWRHCSNLFIWGPTPPSLTSGGRHWNRSIYGFHAGGTYHTGMLSCLNVFGPCFSDAKSLQFFRWGNRQTCRFHS